MTALSATKRGKTEKSNLDITEMPKNFLSPTTGETLTHSHTYINTHMHTHTHTHTGAEKILMMFDC